MKVRVADYIAEHLVKYGIKKAFLLSGGGMMHLLDGLAKNKNIEIVCHHNEQCAGIAAEGYSRVKGDVSVCFATSGPGALNIVMPVAGAWYDSVPVVFITGQSKKCHTIRGTKISGLRQFGTFETDIIEIVKSITKFTWFLDGPSDIPYVLDKAINIAKSGRPGPVLIDIPVDVQGASFETDLAHNYLPIIEKHTPELNIIETILEKWNNAKKPVILLGHGVRVAKVIDDVKKLSNITDTPIVTTQLGKDVVAYDYLNFIGHPGIKGDRAGNFAVQYSDFILCLGTSLHAFTTGYEIDKFATGAFIARVDLDLPLFDREEVKISCRCYADLKSFTKMTISKIEETKFEKINKHKWMNWLTSLKLKFDVMKEPHKEEKGRINIYKAIDIINSTTKGDEIIVNDAGSAFYTIGQAWKIKGTQRIITSGGLGSMGWALPAATGAAKAKSNKNVICFTGDGSLCTNLHELAVISKNSCNVKIIIFNNDGYLSIKNTQDNYFNGRYAGINGDSGVFIPSIQKTANAFNLRSYLADNEKKLSEIIEKEFQIEGPCIIELLTNVDQEIIPTVSSKKMDDGSMISMPLQNMSPFLDEHEFEKLVAEIK